MAQKAMTEVPVPEDMIYDDFPTMSTYNGNMGRTSVYHAIKHFDYPQPYQFGPRLVRWKRSEVKAWMESRSRGTRPTGVDRARQKEVA